MKRILCLIFILIPFVIAAQGLRWSADGNSYYLIKPSELTQYVLPGTAKNVIISSADLKPPGQDKSLTIRDYSFANDGSQVLIYTNTKRVWRLDTEGDYWILNLRTKNLRKIGLSQPESTLRFAKLSPDITIRGRNETRHGNHQTV